MMSVLGGLLGLGALAGTIGAGASMFNNLKGDTSSGVRSATNASNIIKNVANEASAMRNAKKAGNASVPLSFIAGSPSPSLSSGKSVQVTAINSAPSAKTVGSTSGTASMPMEYADILSELKSAQASTNAYNEAQAAQHRDWQAQQNKIAMDFNAAEAAKNRDWQEMMSNTAHQREVRDLQAAGLNPVLSASGGNGAPVSSGATASGVTSSGSKSESETVYNMALLNFLNNVMGYATQTAVAGIGAGSAVAVQRMREEHDKWTYQNQPSDPWRALFGALNDPQGTKSKASNLLKALF